MNSDASELRKSRCINSKHNLISKHFNNQNIHNFGNYMTSPSLEM